MTDKAIVKISSEFTQIRKEDGYCNATSMCKAVNKMFHDYRRLSSTKAYMAALSRSTGIPADVLMSQVTTGPNKKRGTWVHPKVAIHLAQWLSPEFAVSVTNLVHDWMAEQAGKALPASTKNLDLPPAETGRAVEWHLKKLTEKIGHLLLTNKDARKRLVDIEKVLARDPDFSSKD